MLEINKLYLGDCLELMKQIGDQSINMILCDLPYGMTDNEWDSIIPIDELWNQYKRIIKPKGVIVLTAMQPFASKLIISNYQWFKYEWIWEKSNITGHLNAKKQPLRKHENIIIFSNGQGTYNPQMMGIGKKRRIAHRKNTRSTNYGKRGTYFDFSSGKSYPKSIISYGYDKEKLHPTQKPINLFIYLIETYTNEGDLILDNCIGSGTTAIAAIQTERNWIGIEKDKNYYKMAKERIEKQNI